MRRAIGAAPDAAVTFPTVTDGARGVAFIEAAVKSSQRNAAWVKVREALGHQLPAIHLDDLSGDIAGQVVGGEIEYRARAILRRPQALCRDASCASPRACPASSAEHGNRYGWCRAIRH